MGVRCRNGRWVIENRWWWSKTGGDGVKWVVAVKNGWQGVENWQWVFKWAVGVENRWWWSKTGGGGVKWVVSVGNWW